MNFCYTHNVESILESVIFYESYVCYFSYATQEAAAAAAAAEAADVEKKRQDEDPKGVSLRWSWLGVFFMYTPRKN